MAFSPHAVMSDRQFKADVQYLQSRGKKVLISIGGATGSIAVDSYAAQDELVRSITAMIREYGFNGVDINLEGTVVLERNDTDFREPRSPAIRHLIGAVRQIRGNFGPDFILSLAPETINVQGGYHGYDRGSGSYLPVIHGLRDILTYVHVQHYNSGPLAALDIHTYQPGTADFHVAMIDMLLQGFRVYESPGGIFPPLKPEQTVLGLAARPEAVSRGYTAPLESRMALDYLARGASFEGGYTLRVPAGYAGLRGVMTWSINWDAVDHYRFSGAIRTFLDGLP